LIQDAEGRTFKFDGNDKQIEVKDTSQTVVGKYFFGERRRIKKISDPETASFLARQLLILTQNPQGKKNTIFNHRCTQVNTR
jgi:hypothetical protein